MKLLENIQTYDEFVNEEAAPVDSPSAIPGMGNPDPGTATEAGSGDVWSTSSGKDKGKVSKSKKKTSKKVSKETPKEEETEKDTEETPKKEKKSKNKPITSFEDFKNVMDTIQPK